MLLRITLQSPEKQEEDVSEGTPMQNVSLLLDNLLMCIYHSCFTYTQTLALTCSSNAKIFIVLDSWTLLERRKETLREQRRLYHRLLLVGFTVLVTSLTTTV